MEYQQKQFSPLNMTTRVDAIGVVIGVVQSNKQKRIYKNAF